MKTKRVNETNKTEEIKNCEVCDSLGREIGLSIIRFECDFVIPESYDVLDWYSSVYNGHYYAVNAHTTRNNARYGRLQNTMYFETIEGREAYIANRWSQIIKNTRKAGE